MRLPYRHLAKRGVRFRVLVEVGLTEDGWVKVDPLILNTPFPAVYALGDCAATGIPKAGVFAESAARTVADEIADSIRGSRSRRYDGTGLCFVEIIGVDIVRGGRWLPQLVEAFRVGNAPPPLPWEPEGREEANRALYINLLGTEWLPAIIDADARLRAEPPARVLDVACGTGWSGIAMAQAYPNLNVDGVDLDQDAISAARRNAQQAGVADRVTFSVADAADLGGAGGYVLVTISETPRRPTQRAR